MSRRKLIVATAQGWFDNAMDPANPMSVRLSSMENALNHTENALFAANQAKEQAEAQAALLNDHKETTYLFYGDLRFCYKLLPGVPIAGENPVYTEVTLGRAKMFTPEQYSKMHENFRVALSKQLECDISLIEPISGEEYEAHVDVDEQDDK